MWILFLDRFQHIWIEPPWDSSGLLFLLLGDHHHSIHGFDVFIRAWRLFLCLVFKLLEELGPFVWRQLFLLIVLISRHLAYLWSKNYTLKVKENRVVLVPIDCLPASLILCLYFFIYCDLLFNKVYYWIRMWLWREAELYCDVGHRRRFVLEIRVLQESTPCQITDVCKDLIKKEETSLTAINWGYKVQWVVWRTAPDFKQVDAC